MDQIQKILVKAGHKDLAQEYYKKIAQEMEYVDVLKADPKWEDLETGLASLKSIWTKWKNLPETEISDITPAKVELRKYLEKRLIHIVR
jgi:hypothetical protein